MTGARSVKAISEQYKMKPKYVFIAPPAIEKLLQRLELR
jgi:guanylate kinase